MLRTSNFIIMCNIVLRGDFFQNQSDARMRI